MSKKPKRQSRATRWGAAVATATSALEELISIQEEFQNWRDNLPENLQGSALGEKLDFVSDLDLESAKDALEEASSADLPLGFGRD